MLTETIWLYLLYYFLLSPLFKLLAINLKLMFFGSSCNESLVRKLTQWVIPFDFIHVLIVLLLLIKLGPTYFVCKLFGVIPFAVHFSWPVIASLSFSVFLLNLVNYFSCSYLHKDQYFHKFFTLYYLLKFAVILLSLSDATQFIFMGWELLGLSSVLLVGFYEHRMEPIKNSIRILFIYKVSDVFLFSAFLIALLSHIEYLSQLGLPVHGGEHTVIYLLMLVACMIKSGVFPWQWLPKAMEGPTPSSSIFYGALATHIPLVLLARIWPDYLTAPHAISYAGIFICLVSALLSNNLSKQSADAKNSLSYAITTQLALIYIEIFLGFTSLAFVHAISHGLYRTFELLKTPSVIHTLHTIELNRNKGLETKFVTTNVISRFIYRITLRKYHIQCFLFKFIDDFFGLNATRRTLRHFIRFSFYSFILWVVISFLSLSIRKEHYDILNDLIIFSALLFTFASFKNLKKTIWFLIFVSTSMGLLYLSLFSKFFVELRSFEWILLAFISVPLVLEFKKQTALSREALSFSKRKNLLILLLGFCIVGIPGLVGYFLWENLLHVVAFISPHLVVSAFFVMSLNTILFIIFYYQYLLRTPTKKESMP